MSALRRGLDALLPAGVDRRAIVALTLGHVGSDIFQGAVPALVVFWVAERGWTYGQAGLLVLAGSLASSLLQPLAGAIGDRVAAPWLVPLGLVLAGGGLAGAGLLRPYGATFAALVVGGLGVAVFHPEAVRAARRAAGPHAGAAMGTFAVGGNAGFALGPALIAPAVILLGLGGTALVAAVPLAAALVIVRAARTRGAVAPAAARAHGRARPWTFLAAATAATLRTGFMFGMLAFVPAWYAAELGVGAGTGSAVVAAMLAAGAIGTYAGARVGDRIGHARVAVRSLALLVPLAALVVPAGRVDPLVASALLLAIGLVMDANFYPLVLVAQDALPGRVGLASGVVIGLAVGIGAGMTSLLGLLADAHGVEVALEALTALAALALATALPLVPRRRA